MNPVFLIGNDVFGLEIRHNGAVARRRLTLAEWGTVRMDPTNEERTGYYDDWTFSVLVDGVLLTERMQPVVAVRYVAQAIAGNAACDAEASALFLLMSQIAMLGSAHHAARRLEEDRVRARSEQGQARLAARRAMAQSGPWAEWLDAHPPIEVDDDEDPPRGYDWHRTPAEARGWARHSELHDWLVDSDASAPPPWDNTHDAA